MLKARGLEIMNLRNCLRPGAVLGSLALAAAWMGLAPETRANVYATNLKLNGGFTNVAAFPGAAINVSYILNEPAALVTISILAGTNTVTTITPPPGGPGTVRGANTVVWEGKDAGGSPLSAATYSVSVTTASAGYTNWTETTDDNNPLNYVFSPRGIAVDKNPASPYYGRVFVASAHDGFLPSRPGDNTGLLMLNADGSAGDEGVLSTGGYAWAGDYFSPWKVQVSADDFVYVNDFHARGLIYRWDPVLSSGSRLNALRSDNLARGVQLSGPSVSGTGANTALWQADTSTAGSRGILKFALAANGACAAHDVGTTVVGLDAANMSVAPYDVAVGSDGAIYTIQNIADPANPAARVLRFPAYDPSTNQNVPEIEADWMVADADGTYGQPAGLASDPTGTYLAVAFTGVFDLFGDLVQGNTKVFYAATGAVAANLDLNTVINGGSADHEDWDCAWDAVGNVYYVDASDEVWRAFSPPGTNQATTLALTTITLLPLPQITGVGVLGGTATLVFTGLAGDTPGAFSVQSAANASGPYTDVPATITQVSAGEFRAAPLAAGPCGFYRIRRQVQ